MPPPDQVKKNHITIIPKAITSVRTGSYVIDSYVTGWSEPTHTLKSHIAQEPLEDGVVVTDHVVAMPVQLDLKGMVSDVRDGADAPGRAWDKVRELHNNRDILDVLTEWGYYKDMVIKNAETKQTGRGMQFQLTLQQILRVGLFKGVVENPVNLRTEELLVPIFLDPAGDGAIVADDVTNTLRGDPQSIGKKAQELNFGFTLGRE